MPQRASERAKEREGEREKEAWKTDGHPPAEREGEADGRRKIRTFTFYGYATALAQLGGRGRGVGGFLLIVWPSVQ